jgi:hypothetical protein
VNITSPALPVAVALIIAPLAVVLQSKAMAPVGLVAHLQPQVRLADGSLAGFEAPPVTVEVHIAGGLPAFTIVGLPDVSCRESRDRVRAAVVSSGFQWPQRRVTVNLAPTTLRKVGSGLDLAMAVGFLVATQQLPRSATEGRGYLAELGLDGSLRPVPGVLPALDPLATLQAVSEERCTHLHGVPTMFIAQLDHPRFAEFDLASLRANALTPDNFGAPENAGLRALRSFLRRYDPLDAIELTHPETIAGMGLLVALGILTQVRADEILAHQP